MYCVVVVAAEQLQKEGRLMLLQPLLLAAVGVCCSSLALWFCKSTGQAGVAAALLAPVLCSAAQL
jgi:hypothetical protein